MVYVDFCDWLCKHLEIEIGHPVQGTRVAVASAFSSWISDERSGEKRFRYPF